jgi:membrane glycosyltransferase
MLTQSIDVVAILLGRDSGWNAQRRDDGSIPMRETARAYRRHTLLGLALGGIAWAVSLSLALWMLPVVLGLALAIPLAMVTGQRSVGLALRRLGLLRIPEEAAPPPVLVRAMALQRELATAESIDALRLLHDPTLMAAHRAMLPAPRRPRIDPLDVTLLVGRAKLAEAETASEGWAALTPAEQAACLADAEALDRLAAMPANR